MRNNTALLLGLVLLLHANQMTSAVEVIRTDSRLQQFTPDFSAEWYTYDDGSNKPTLRISLKLDNIDTSGWTTTDGNFGYWVGIGFGALSMPGSDIIMCLFRYRN